MRMTAHVFWSDFFAAASRLKPGFHLIATIVAIAEKRKFNDRSDHSDHNYGNHSPAIAAITAG